MRMADGPRSGQIDEDEGIDLTPLLRLGAWGMAATVALALAVIASRTDTGERRAGAALAPSHAAMEQTRTAIAQLAARANDAERESRHLSELVRSLTSDRDQLATRVSQLQRNLEDLTGSIALTQPSRRSPGAAAIASAPPAPPAKDKEEPAPATTEPAAQAPPPLPRVEVRPAPEPRDVASAGPATTTITVEPAATETPGEDAPAEIPLPRPNPLFLAQAMANTPGSRIATSHGVATGEIPAETPTRSRIGVDLGGATSVETLRSMWTKLKESQSPLLANLRPVIAVRESNRPGAVELRLVAGPLVNQGAAARLCSALTAASIQCRAATYEGQWLAGP